MSAVTVAAAVCSAGLISGAEASTLGGRNNPDANGTSFTVDGGAGETNRVTLSRASGAIVFRDAGAPIRLSTEETNELPPCSRPTPNQLRCRAIGPGDIVGVDLGDGNDTLTVLSVRVRYAIGGAGNDLIIGHGSSEEFTGGLGNDTLKGRAGNDRLYGGPGADYLSAAAGNDRLFGGPGLDTFRAYTGNDYIDSADGLAESVDCSAGIDTVRADRADRLIRCERVTRV